MKAKISTTAVAFVLMNSAFSQSIMLNFTALDNATYQQLDSVKVMNRTQQCDTVLLWPDTVLSFSYVGITEPSGNKNAFRVFQNFPNPMTEFTTISLYIPETNLVKLFVTDFLGRVVGFEERILPEGFHSFRLKPGSGNVFTFTAQWKKKKESIRILQSESGTSGDCSLEYTGPIGSLKEPKATLDIQGFLFHPGDTLLYIGYINGQQSGILDNPIGNHAYSFQFATNIPCPGITTVDYEGQVYNTIQIYSQCWLKENLNVGTMVLANVLQSNNGILEKYCYWNLPDSCLKYGGLYQWSEMMQYSLQPGVQGICPPGWHIPEDNEWKVLEGSVDSQFGIGDPEWDLLTNYRGMDAATNLKTTSGWYQNNNGTDLFGFSGMPGGYRYGWGSFFYATVGGLWWTSTEGALDSAFERLLDYDEPGVNRSDEGIGYGLSVRCLKDN